MEPALGPVREVLSRVQFHVPSFPIVPNVSATPTTQPSALRDCLSRHLISPVRWDATMRAMEDAGVTWFVETGPGDVLAKLARRAVPGSVVRAVGSPDEARAVADEVRREQDDF
jgi:[acyl-carrier-protein] S-malonyltransferase